MTTQYVGRDPRQPNRTGRFMSLVQQILNDLLRAGDVAQNATTRRYRVVAAAANSGSMVCLFDHYADVSNVGVAETTLYSDTILANQLVASGDKLFARYHVRLANNGNSTQVFVKFAGNTIFSSGAFANAGEDLDVQVFLMRSGTTTARTVVSGNIHGKTCVVPGTQLTGINWATTNVLKITGQGGADGDTTAKFGTVSYQPAA